MHSKFFKLHTFAACCYKIKVGYITGNKGAHKAVSGIYGYYYAQPGNFGGKSWYKSSDGSTAVWYTSNGQWHIGRIGNVGGRTSKAYVDSEDRCPYSPAYSWRFYNDNLGSWYDADKSLSICCISK